MVGVGVASQRINVFLLETSECAAVLGAHPHVLPEIHRTKHTHTDKATNFSLLVVYHWSSPHHTSLTHVGPDRAGHQ